MISFIMARIMFSSESQHHQRIDDLAILPLQPRRFASLSPQNEGAAAYTLQSTNNYTLRKQLINLEKKQDHVVTRIV